MFPRLGYAGAGHLAEFYANRCEVIHIVHIAEPLFKYMSAKLNYEIQKVDPKLYLFHHQLTKWIENSSQSPHIDSWHNYASILYLNDDLEGGETSFGKQKVEPREGRLIIFEGGKIKHGVSKIKKGLRYTLPAWYNYYNPNEQRPSSWWHTK